MSGLCLSFLPRLRGRTKVGVSNVNLSPIFALLCVSVVNSCIDCAESIYLTSITPVLSLF